MIGRVLDGRFTIEARLGAGSMGTVYRAKQHAMGRDVAIKILRSDRALDESARARFLREARANSLLASPHTVTVFDFGQADNGDFFLAMELLEGESLGQRLQREKRLPPENAIDVTRQALRSLAEAHAKGIIHRDLKPDNLFFSKMWKTNEHGEREAEEIVKVVDFGIAKMLSAENAAMNAVETQAGTVFGTPRYMSPEQAQGKPLDARSDLYSLGVILYHMLTGRPPFTDDDAIVVMARHIKTPPKRPIEAAPQANIPVEVDNVVMRILSKEPAQRPGSAEAMSQELARAMGAWATAATSGMRVSLAGSTIQSPSASAPPTSVPSPPGVPQIAVPTPGVAQVVPKPPESLSSMPSTDSVQIAVGLPTKHSRRRGALAAIAGLGLVAIGAVAMFASRGEPTRAPLDVSRQPSAPSAPAPLPAPFPPIPSAAPAPTVTPAATSTVPTTSFNDLPRAPPEPSTPPPRREPPPPPHSRGHAHGSNSSPSPSATNSAGHYGLFE